MNAIAPASNLPISGPELDGRRTLAALLDLVIVAAGATAILFAAGVLPDGSVSDRTPALDALLLGWALYYYFACESTGGQTLGKKLLKLRVLKADGSPVGTREVAVRTALRVVDGIGLYLVGLIVMLVTGERRSRFGDLAAGTMVADASGAFVPAGSEPAAPAAPEAPSATITLPPRPEPAAVATPAPEVPELRPFDPGLVADPEPEVPVVEEPAVEAEEPVAEEAAPVGEPVPEEPVIQPEDVASPSLKELARDVAVAVAASSEDEREELAEDAPLDEPVTVKPVETVSAIDLVMGHEEAGDEDGGGSPSAAETPGA